KTWGVHSLQAVAGYEFNDYRGKVLDVYGTGFIPGFEVLDVVATPERTKGSINEWAVQSLLSKANYAFDNRYLIELSILRDVASIFVDNAKYTNLFSISRSWNIRIEEWNSKPRINNLMMSTSYGSSGNRTNSLYEHLNLH